MQPEVIPILLFLLASFALSVGLLGIGRLFGPHRNSAVKEMPYESGMDPIHASRRRFDIRFHLVAIAFLVFDVEILFLYPWAVALKNPAGVEAAVQADLVSGRGIVALGMGFFLLLVVLGLVYDWRKGLFRWR